MTTKRFTASVVRSGDRTGIVIPFDPDEAWGVKERHHVAGSINDHNIRACLDPEDNPCILWLGPAWLRDNDLGNVENVEVSLAPEGHQIDNISPDIGDALKAEPDARAFFESLPSFYRNNYIRWIESARRPETRSRRIAETVALLKAGQKRQ